MSVPSIARPRDAGSGKVAARKCMESDPCLAEAFQTEPPDHFDVYIDDFIGTIRSTSVVDEFKNPITGREYYERLMRKVIPAFSRSQIVVLYTDKHAPPTKGQTQRGRVEDVEIPQVVVVKGDTPTPAEHKAIVKRQNAINRSVRIKQQRTETLSRPRDRFITDDDTIPQPFMEFTGSKYRPQVMPFIINKMIDDPTQNVQPAMGHEIIIDGHWMLPEKYPENIKRDFAPNTLNNTNPHFRKKALTTPISLSNYFEHNPDDDDENEMYDYTYVDENGVSRRRQPHITALEEFQNNNGEFDCGFLLYIVWMMVKRDKTTFLIRTADTDIILNSLWFLYRLRHNPESFRLIYNDDSLDYTPKQTAENKQMIEKLKSMSDNLQLWIEYGKKDKVTQRVDVVRLYQKLSEKFGGAHCDHWITSVLTCMVSCSSDFTMGYYNIGMWTMLNAFYSNCGVIGNLVKFENSNGIYTPSIVARAHLRLIKCCYLQANRPKFVPPAQKAAIAAAKKKRKSEDTTSESLPIMPEDVPLDPNHYKLPAIRRKLAGSLSRKDRKCLLEPRRVLEMTQVDFDLFCRRVSKIPPCNKQIEARLLLVQSYLIQMSRYGNAVMEFPDPLQYGFELIDKFKPARGSNLRMMAEKIDTEWKSLRCVGELMQEGVETADVLFRERCDEMAHNWQKVLGYNQLEAKPPPKRRRNASGEDKKRTKRREVDIRDAEPDFVVD